MWTRSWAVLLILEKLNIADQMQKVQRQPFIN